MDSKKTSQIDLRLSEIYHRFYNAEHLELAIADITKDICTLFDLDIASVSIRNDIEHRFVKLFEYKNNGDIKIYEDAVRLTGHYSNIHTDDSIDFAERNYINIYNGQSFFYTKDPNSIYQILKDCNYFEDCNNVINNDITEIFMHYTKIEDYFSFVVFERHNKTPLTELEIKIIANICNVVQGRIEKAEFQKLLYNDRKIKDAIINNENMPVCMIEKTTYKIILFNELYKQIIPNIKTNAVCYELLNKKAPCPNCCFIEDQLSKNDLVDGKYWIKKSVPFKLMNGMEVNLVYAKDTDDYVKQLDSLDLLTSSLSLKGLTNYYNKIIRQNNKTYVLVTLDIDKFKYINNNFGFKIGDKVLKQTALVIREFVSSDEMFCRINEDKFAIILRYDQKNDLNIKFETLKLKLKKMQEKYFIDKRLNFIGGITDVNKDLELNILIDHANVARKSIKGAHKSTFAFYDIEAEQKAKKENIIEKRMAFAIQNDEFIPYLQPKFDLNTRTIKGAEALVRWITPEGMIYPDEFIPLFEKNGFIRTLDFIIYDKVMNYIRQCLDRGLPVYPVSLNVSRNHIQDDNFTSKVIKLVKKYDIPLEYIELEVTESVFVEDKEILKQFIDKIKLENIRVSIDDFGTAYSSLHVLTDVNVDVLKIDKGFLNNIQDVKTKASKDEIIIKNIINMAQELDFQVVCEGVETDQQIELLKNIGCELGQGYVFAKPMPISEYEERFLCKGV